jgi:phosphopantothenoylcysteine decarboxylase/phosphopantothenate--cysteine ligase
VLAGKHILLGVTGGIAAYKSAFLVRELLRAGAEVQVVMTPHATEFITPLTLSTLSRREVIVEMFPRDRTAGGRSWTHHIELGQWADLMLIAPATANTIARIAAGSAEDFLTTLVLALRCPLALAPAMDADMYRHETTLRNLSLLRERGCFVIEPGEGELASGLHGPGRLPEVDRLLAFTGEVLARSGEDLRGQTLLVTAGPTQEPIDPVRYLGNRSSGRMGFALAAAASHRGADVVLVAGPVQLETPRNVRRIDVGTAAEMAAAVDAEFPAAAAVLMAAAVADFTPAAPAASKIKRNAEGGAPTLLLKPNPDILAGLGARKSGKVLVGFALETDDDLAHAGAKLSAKNLDMIVLNNPRDPGAGFGTETNRVTILRPGQAPEPLPLMHKYDVAHAILDRLRPLLR